MTTALSPAHPQPLLPSPAPSLSRRSAILGAAGGLGLAAVATAAPSSAALAAGARRRSRPSARQIRVRTNARMVAVRVFPSYNTGVYQHRDAVLQRLADLGVRRMSHKLTPSIARDAAVIEFTRRAYFDHGIKSWLTVGEPLKPLSAAEWDTMVAALTGPLAGMVDRVYGWNEPNHVRNGGPLPRDWHLTTGAHQRELWRRVSPLGIKVGTPSLWSGDFAKHDADLAALAPQMAGSFDHIGWHLYPRGTVGIDLIDRFEATYRRVLGSYPVVCTEAGQFTAPRYTGRAVNVSESEQADYVPRLVEEYVRRGHGISYFELLDDPDPTGGEREAHLGLIRTPTLDPATWEPKPAYESLRAHLAMPTPRGRPASPGPA